MLTYLSIMTERVSMIPNDYMRGFWLYFVYQDSRRWAKHDTRSFNRDQSGLLAAERVNAAKDGWCKPDVKSWYELDAGFGFAPTEPPLSGQERERFTKYLTNTLESENLVEIKRASNRRIAWVRLTPAGEAEAVRLNPQLGEHAEPTPEQTDDQLEQRTLAELELQIEKAGRHRDWLREQMRWLRKRDGKAHPTNPVEWKEFERELQQIPKDLKRIRETLKKLRAGQITAKAAGRLFDAIYY